MGVEKISLEEYRRLTTKQNKYRAKKVKIDGMIFDSQKEGTVYLGLKQDKKDGRIKDFEIHPKELLIEPFSYWDDGKKRSLGNATYEPDFVIKHTNGMTEYLEVKGGDATKTPEWRLKFKMTKYKNRERKDVKYTIV